MRILNLAKKSNQRLIVAGNYIQLIEYEIPYFYNLDPRVKTNFSSVPKENRTNFSINRTRQAVFYLIEANKECSKGNMNVFITFTFAKNIKDIKQANKEWKLFIMRLKYFYKIKFKYLVVMEFQKRGAIHYHALFFNMPYIHNIKKDFADLWGQGFINIKAINAINSISAYVAKYIQKEIFDKRLMVNKAYFTSRNLIKPVLYRNPQNILTIMNQYKTIKLLKAKRFSSGRFGNIDYKDYQIIN